MNIRLQNLDLVKGLAIIGVVYGHLELADSIVKTCVYAFHLPVFFMVCGILIRKKYWDKLSDISLKNHFQKRVRQLFVPYFIFGLLKIIFYVFLSFAAYKTIDWSQFYELFTSLLVLRGVGALWFIPCYFISEFFFLFF